MYRVGSQSKLSWAVLTASFVVPTLVGAATFGLTGLAVGCLVGLPLAGVWAFRAPVRAVARKHFVLRSKTPPAGTACSTCARRFRPLEPVFSCVESGRFLHARCRKHHHHHHPHQEALAA